MQSGVVLPRSIKSPEAKIFRAFFVVLKFFRKTSCKYPNFEYYQTFSNENAQLTQLPCVDGFCVKPSAMYK
jgi:hypothetical protein